MTDTPTVRGFTLVEVLVALAVSAVLLAMIHGLTAGVAERTEAMLRQARRANAEANGWRWLRGALSSIVPPDDSFPFAGGADSLSFFARTRRAGGWYLRERITVRLDSGSVVAARSESKPVVVAGGVLTATFDYLIEGGGRDPWMKGWVSYASTPAVARLRLHRSGRAGSDTLLFMIRDRR